MPFVGMQATHRGNRICCASSKYVQGSPKDFWHSDYVKQVRDKMQKGELLDECKRCYREEDNDQFSLRQHYNAYFKEVGQSDQPLSFDLDFSNLCNLKCIMCGPDRSSQWSKELGHKDVTPISKSKIDQLCDMADNLQHMTIQGGEPSIMPEFEYLFEKLVTNGQCDKITIDCISNLTNVNNKFYTLLENFKTVNLNVSVDSYGKINDYIRYPSKFTTLEANLLSLIDRDIQANLQITLQTLSLINFGDFLDWIDKVHQQFKSAGKTLGLNMSFVSDKDALNPLYAPNKLKAHFIADIEKFLKNKQSVFDMKFTLALHNLKNTFVSKNTIEKVPETMEYLANLNQRRNIKVEDYIEKFEKYFKKPVK